MTVYRSLTPGDDVGCRRRDPTGVQDVYIFHAPEKSAAQLLADAEREVTAGDPTAVMSPGVADTLSALPGSLTVPEHVSAGLTSATHGYRILLGKLGDWAVETRFVGGPAVAASPALDTVWLATVVEGRRHGPSPADPASAPTTASPASPEVLRAQADQLMVRSTAPDLFENLTTEKIISIRHRPSGFVCSFESAQAENILQVFAASVRGTDIGCTTRLGPAVASFFVTRFPSGTPTPQQAMTVYLADVRKMHPDMAQAKGPFLSASAKAKPGDPAPVPRLTAHLTYADHGEAAYSRVSVSVVKGWVIEQRITAPLAQQQVADLIGEVTMMAAVDKMNREQAT